MFYRRCQIFEPTPEKTAPAGGAKYFRNGQGFSLIECIIALVVLMVASLAVISVFDYSFKSGESARKRFAALLLAEQHFEDLRNTPFNDLAAGTVTQQNVVYDGVSYTLVRTITDNDLVTVAEAPGAETKRITITITPVSASLVSEAVTLTTFRAKNAPGPKRESNTP